MIGSWTPGRAFEHLLALKQDKNFSISNALLASAVSIQSESENATLESTGGKVGKSNFKLIFEINFSLPSTEKSSEKRLPKVCLLTSSSHKILVRLLILLSFLIKRAIERELRSSHDNKLNNSTRTCEQNRKNLNFSQTL